MRWFSCLPLFLKKKLIKHSSVFIPYQNCSFPWPIIRYLCSTGHSKTQLKLFSTCQQLKNIIAKIRDHQIDKLQYSTHINTHVWSITDKKEIYLRWCCHKNRKKLMPKTLKVKHLEVDVYFYNFDEDMQELSSFFKELDISILESARMNINSGSWGHKIKVLGDIYPIFSQSLTEITFDSYIKLVHGDLLTMALTELPNLKKLTMRWQAGITNLSTATLITRSKKLQRLELTWVTMRFIPQIISNFIIHQMSDHSETEFFMYNYKSRSYACECVQKEMNDTIQEKLKGAKFILSVLYSCNH